MHNFDKNGIQRLPEKDNSDYADQAPSYQLLPQQPYYDDPNIEPHDGTNMDPPPQVPPYQQPQTQPYNEDANIEPHDGTNMDPPQVPPYQPPQPQPYYEDPNIEPHGDTNIDPPQVPPNQPPQPQPYYEDPNIEPHDDTNMDLEIWVKPKVPPYQPPQPQPYYEDPNHGLQVCGPDTQYVLAPSRQTMTPRQGQRPSNWTVPACFACLFCCWPLGLAAIRYAIKATKLVDEGNMVEARKAAGMAKVLIIASIVSGIVFSVGYGLWNGHVIN